MPWCLTTQDMDVLYVSYTGIASPFGVDQCKLCGYTAPKSRASIHTPWSLIPRWIFRLLERSLRSGCRFSPYFQHCRISLCSPASILTALYLSSVPTPRSPPHAFLNDGSPLQTFLRSHLMPCTPLATRLIPPAGKTPRHKNEHRNKGKRLFNAA